MTTLKQTQRTHMPVELITSNVVWEAIEQSSRIPDFLSAIATSENIASFAMRELLQRIAAKADMAIVMAALAAVGAPSDIDAMSQRIAATREQLTRKVGP